MGHQALHEARYEAQHEEQQNNPSCSFRTLSLTGALLLIGLWWAPSANPRRPGKPSGSAQ